MTQPIEWPALMICKLPRFKNKEKYQEFTTKGFFGTFASQEEFDKLKNEAFDSDIKKFIHAITIAKTYLKGLKRVNEIKLEKPYISSVLVGFTYYGNCASISFQSLRAFLVQKGEIDKHDITSSFFASIFLKVSTTYAQYFI